MKQQSSPTNRGDLSPGETGLERAVPQVTKTPLFQANNSDRYRRQKLVNQIQDRTNRLLICYVSGDSDECVIDAGDTMPFVDLLHNVPSNRDVDLLLHTIGGNVDAAEKLLLMMRSKVDRAALRIIVPEYAKSAGTLMVLGADSVVMSDMSELGPIDPQIPLFGRWQSVQNYLDAYETHAETLKNDPDNIAARVMLDKLDPATLKLCEVATARARQAAESLLRDGMFRDNDGNWSKTADELLATTRWLSHGQMISWEDARNPQIGLAVEHLEYHSETWQDYWQLYCLQRLAVGNRQKLYESDCVSLVIGPAR